jgi:hypothetical protein
VGKDVTCSSAPLNKGKSALSFCHQMAAAFPDMFCKFYLLKNHKMAKNSTTAKAREKMSTDLESLEHFMKKALLTSLNRIYY